MKEPSEQESQPRGLICPKCHCRQFYLVKITHAIGYVRRRRECRHCGHRITTSERIVGRA